MTRDEEKAARLAAALRANLRRRKAQARAAEGHSSDDMPIVDTPASDVPNTPEGSVDRDPRS